MTFLDSQLSALSPINVQEDFTLSVATQHDYRRNKGLEIKQFRWESIEGN